MMSVAVNPRTDGGKKTGKRASAEGALAVRWESITSLHVLWLEPGEQVCSPATTTKYISVPAVTVDLSMVST